MNIEERITELEIQFTHQENTIADLNDVILSQQKTIDSLESRLLKIESAIKSVSLSNIKDPSEESSPPHY
jgi:SlyX protein